jgi:hypothetical protein
VKARRPRHARSKGSGKNRRPLPAFYKLMVIWDKIGRSDVLSAAELELHDAVMAAICADVDPRPQFWESIAHRLLENPSHKCDAVIAVAMRPKGKKVIDAVEDEADRTGLKATAVNDAWELLRAPALELVRSFPNSTREQLAGLLFMRLLKGPRSEGVLLG